MEVQKRLQEQLEVSYSFSLLFYNLEAKMTALGFFLSLKFPVDCFHEHKTHLKGPS